MAGYGRLTYNSKTVRLGYITSLNDSINVTVPSFTTPMLKAEQQFGMDSGASESIDLSLVQVHDAEYNGHQTSNAEWIQDLEDAVNRWQSQSNGAVFHYTRDAENVQFIPEYNVNVYINSFSYTWKAGSPEIIDGSLKLAVGSLTGGSATYETDDYIDKEESEVNIILSTRDVSGNTMAIPNWETYNVCGMDSGSWDNLVEKMVLKGGLNQPFESLELTIPRKRLEDLGIDFSTMNPISLGYTMVEINGSMGYGHFIIQGAEAKDNDYVLTAYSVAEVLSSTYTDHKLPVDGLPNTDKRPRKIIQDILDTGVVVNGKRFRWAEEATPICESHDNFPYMADNNTITGNIFWQTRDYSWDAIDDTGIWPEFPKGTNAWYVLQVCAYACGAKIHFSDGDCYITEMREEQYYDEAGQTVLYDVVANRLVTESCPIVNSPQIGNEQINCVINSITAYFGNPDSYNQTTVEEYSNASEQLTSIRSTETYGHRNKVIRLPYIYNINDAVTIAKNMLYFSMFGGQSLTIDVNENIDENSDELWRPYFGTQYLVKEIDDYYNEFHQYANVRRDGSSTPFKAYATTSLASYERQFPRFICRYVFGPIDNANLPLKFKQVEETGR